MYYQLQKLHLIVYLNAVKCMAGDNVAPDRAGRFNVPCTELRRIVLKFSTFSMIDRRLQLNKLSELPKKAIILFLHYQSSFRFLSFKNVKFGIKMLDSCFSDLRVCARRCEINTSVIIFLN